MVILMDEYDFWSKDMSLMGVDANCKNGMLKGKITIHKRRCNSKTDIALHRSSLRVGIGLLWSKYNVDQV